MDVKEIANKIAEELAWTDLDQGTDGGKEYVFNTVVKVLKEHGGLKSVSENPCGKFEQGYDKNGNGCCKKCGWIKYYH